MWGLRYLFFTTLKNSIVQLVKNPGKLIAAILFILLFVFVIFSGNLGSGAGQEFRNPQELFAIVFALYLIFFVLGAYKGLTSGASFYSMADVNLLFSAPISSNKILFYGLIRQMGLSLLVGVFILFQYSWLHITYHVNLGGLLAIFLGYCVVLCCSQLTAMAIYSFSNGNPVRKRWIRGILLGGCAVIALAIGACALTADDPFGALIQTVNSPVLSILVPVAGWVQGGVCSAIAGSYLPILWSVLAAGAYMVCIALLIVKTNSDFYEDTLQATEMSSRALDAKKQGNLEAVPGKVKVGQTGLSRGKGASVFFYKHLLEDRRSKFFILDLNSIIFMACIVAFSFFMREEGLLPIFIFATYMQLFSSSFGRWIRELTKPYVYLVPVGPFRKLMMICMENVLKVAIEAVILFVVVAIVLSLSPGLAVVAILARIGFGILFMAGNVLIERILGPVNSKILVMVLYFLIMVAIAIPGLVLAIVFVALQQLVDATLIGLLITVAWNLLASTLILFLCRNMLSFAELNQK